jgi:VWFA-related protein
MAIAAALAAPVAGQQQAPRFRSVAELVLVPVAVTDGNRPVANLTSADFELFDNGVPQALESSTIESLSIDVTLLVDTSGSVEGPALARFASEVQDVALLLHPNDRVRLLTFGTDVRDVTGWQPGGATVPLDRLVVGGATSFYHALAAALMASRPDDRPHLVMGFSDGLDNMSLLDAPAIGNLAGRAQASLYLSLIRSEASLAIGGVVPWSGQPDVRLLRGIVERSGGELYEHRSSASMPQLFRTVIDTFRTMYLLRYTPTGVSSGGWHEIVVRVKERKYTIKARRGYEG